MVSGLLVACWCAAYRVWPGVILLLTPSFVLSSVAIANGQIKWLVWLPLAQTAAIAMVLTPWVTAAIPAVAIVPSVFASCLIAVAVFALGRTASRFDESRTNRAIFWGTVGYAIQGCCWAAFMVELSYLMFQFAVNGRTGMSTEGVVVFLMGAACMTVSGGIAMGIPLGFFAVQWRRQRRVEVIEQAMQLITLQFDDGEFAGHVSFFENTPYPITDVRTHRACSFFQSTGGRVGASAVVGDEHYRIEERIEKSDWLKIVVKLRTPGLASRFADIMNRRP